MVATVTDILKRDLLEEIYNSYQNIGVTEGDSDRFYMAIGRSEEWDSDAQPPVPNSSMGEVIAFQESIQSMKLIPNVSYVVPRYNWSAGSVYEAWDNNYGSNTVVGPFGDIQFPYYVVTDENNVYVCVQQGRSTTGQANTSNFKPTDVTGNPFTTGDDGYVWKFMFSIGTVEARNYLTSAYLPVELILDSSEGGPAFDELSTSRQSQLAVQNAAVPGEVIGIAVEDGGAGFTSVPDVEIVGVSLFGDSVVTAQAFARIYNGSIYEVVMKADSTQSAFTFGANYYTASVNISDANSGGGSGAKLRAITTGDLGMGANPIINLNSSAVMFNATLAGDEGGDFNVSNDFRQIGIVKNPLKDSAQYDNFVGTGRDSAVSASTVYAYKYLALDSANNDLTPDNITGDEIASDAGGASAIVDYYDDQKQYLYCHQTAETGFKPFDGTTVTVSQGGGTSAIRTNSFGPNLRPAEVNNFSGEVIYIDNRSPITRDDEQTEDIKIVIDL